MFDIGGRNEVRRDLDERSGRLGGLVGVQRLGSEDKRAAFDFENAGDNTLVEAVAGKVILVLALILVPAAAMAVRFESGAGGAALTGVMNIGAKDPLVLPYNPEGWFETESSELLNLELGGAQQTSGCLSYVEV